jgi:hypothetical protein
LNNGLNDDIEIDYSLEGNMEVSAGGVENIGVVDVDVDVDIMDATIEWANQVIVEIVEEQFDELDL